MTQLTDADLDYLAQHMDILTPTEAAEVEVMVEELYKRRMAQACRDDLITFCKYMQDDYLVGKHHRILADLLMDSAEGIKTRVCVNIPPRHGKSHLVSTYFPAWFIGKYPTKKILMVSHTTDLAVDFGRKVRNVIDTAKYKSIFPTVSLAADSKSAGRWDTNHGGTFFACGVGSALAGRGADLLLVDDPHNEQDIINGNLEVFAKAYEWFAYGARTRLMPGGRVAIVHCMTGDTRVLLADGAEKLLKDVQVGDAIATYDDGVLGTSKVLNWMSNGNDCVYAIKMTSGTIVRANERHPFLVNRNGVLEWVRLKNLQPGMSLVALTGATAPHDPKANRANALRANPATATIADIPTRLIMPLGTTGNGKESPAQLMGATYPHTLTVNAPLTTTRVDGPQDLPGEAQKVTGALTSNTGTVSPSTSTTGCSPSRTGSAPSVVNHPGQTIRPQAGKASSLLTIVTSPRESGHCSVTHATSLLATAQPKTSCCELSSIYGFTLDQITEIAPDGYEEVFDIQVERTENFIANGLVSHNTRWHADDLTGRLVRDMVQNDGTDQYEVVEFPAIFNESTPTERPLWPEFFDLDALRKIKAGMPLFQWNAQYQQNPTSEEGAVVKREWWQTWRADAPPSCEYVIMSMDTAAESHNRADFTALTVWGVFMHPEFNTYNIILLNSIKRRMEFPELKDLAVKQYTEYEPDAFIVEKKSSGTALYQELRRTGIVVQEYTPHRGSGDKHARLNAVADILRSGLVWAPETRWAEELIEEVAAFPFGSNDDLVDATVMALARFRNGGFVRLPTDEPDALELFRTRKRAYY